MDWSHENWVNQCEKHGRVLQWLSGSPVKGHFRAENPFLASKYKQQKYKKNKSGGIYFWRLRILKKLCSEKQPALPIIQYTKQF